jgi:hypothetical protein
VQPVVQNGLVVVGDAIVTVARYDEW